MTNPTPAAMDPAAEPLAAHDFDRILVDWRDPDSGLLMGTDVRGIRCADFAAYVRHRLATTDREAVAYRLIIEKLRARLAALLPSAEALDSMDADNGEGRRTFYHQTSNTIRDWRKFLAALASAPGEEKK